MICIGIYAISLLFFPLRYICKWIYFQISFWPKEVPEPTNPQIQSQCNVDAEQCTALVHLFSVQWKCPALVHLYSVQCYIQPWSTCTRQRQGARTGQVHCTALHRTALLQWIALIYFTELHCKTALICTVILFLTWTVLICTICALHCTCISVIYSTQYLHFSYIHCTTVQWSAQQWGREAAGRLTDRAAIACVHQDCALNHCTPVTGLYSVHIVHCKTYILFTIHWTV